MAFTWANTIAPNNIIKAAEVTEIRTNLDSIQDNPTCNTNHVSRFVTQYDTDKAAENSNDDVGQDVTHYTGRNAQVDSDQNVTYDAAKDLGYDATKYAQVDSDQNVTYNTAQDLGYDATKYGQVDSDQHLTYDNGQLGTYWGTKNVTYLSDKNNNVYSGRDTAVNSSKLTFGG